MATPWRESTKREQELTNALDRDMVLNEKWALSCQLHCAKRITAKLLLILLMLTHGTFFRYTSSSHAVSNSIYLHQNPPAQLWTTNIFVPNQKTSFHFITQNTTKIRPTFSPSQLRDWDTCTHTVLGLTLIWLLKNHPNLQQASFLQFSLYKSGASSVALVSLLHLLWIHNWIFPQVSKPIRSFDK